MVRLHNLMLWEEPRLDRAICWQHRVLQPGYIRQSGKYAIRKNPSRGEIVVKGKIGRLYRLAADKQCHSQGVTGIPNHYK